ncbi:glutathione S-transferase [Phlebopus sp. FC_14]|nr:glutathione S-transferase [Phlebopus sp. FC_14]
MSNNHLLFYTAPTPNGHKVSILLEELKAVYPHAIDYEVDKVNIATNRQKEPFFIALNPNGRIPVLVDRTHKPDPFPVFESAAILLYLVRKYDSQGLFTFPAGSDEESEMLQWIFFAHGGVGPMQGQAHHFRHYAPEDIPYAKKRYTDETARLYGVLNIRLQGRDYLVGPEKGKLSVADINVFPWVRIHKHAGVETLDAFPNVKAWVERLAARPAVQVGLAVPQ